MLFRPHVGKIYGLNTWYTELENFLKFFMGRLTKSVTDGHFWVSRMDKNVNQCYFFENFQKVEAKVYQCVENHIWIKKVNDSIFLDCAVFDLWPLEIVKLA